MMFARRLIQKTQGRNMFARAAFRHHLNKRKQIAGEANATNKIMLSQFHTTVKQQKEILHDLLEQDTEIKASYQPVRLPPTEETMGKVCDTIDGILTKEESKALINRAEELGFKPALLNVGGGHEIYSPDTRNSDRVIVDDHEFARVLFERIHPFIQKPAYRGGKFEVVGLNERMRILRYKKGHVFNIHSDGSYRRPDGSEVSFCTVMVYLNSGGRVDFDGGSTIFFASRDDVMDDTALFGSHYGVTDEAMMEDEEEKGPPMQVEVIPQAGRVLIFDHSLLHEGAMIHSGVKYVIRTDLMFRYNPSKATHQWK